MAGPPPDVAAVRVAVRRALADLPRGGVVLVGLSGGPDSLALAAATAFLAGRTGLSAGAVVIDHGWTDASGRQAEAAAGQAGDLGLAPVDVVRLVPAAGSPAAVTTETGARELRLGALRAAAARYGAAAVLLGHTADDQAETVLLRLARGSGARSLAGIPAVTSDGLLRRPLLGLDRATTRRACAQLGLRPWDDPANADRRHARSRVRHDALPALVAALGPGVTAGLVRTATALRRDADLLDALAADAHIACSFASDADAGEVLDVGRLAALPAALRTRVLRRAAVQAGARAGGLSSHHTDALDALVDAERWRGQGPVPLPGGVSCRRMPGLRLAFARTPTTAAARGGREPRRPVTLSTPPASAVPAPAEQSPAEPAAYDLHPDVEAVLIGPDAIAAKVAELAATIDAEYAGREVLLVGVLKGAVMFMADLSRALTVPATMEFMAVSSYGSSTSSSGVVRILKDLDRDITDRHVLVVEDVIDSGLTLSWLLRNLRSRGPASVEVVALLRKPEAASRDSPLEPVRYVGFDIPAAFVVGYGLDYAEHYRNLPYVGTLTESALHRTG